MARLLLEQFSPSSGQFLLEPSEWARLLPNLGSSWVQKQQLKTYLPLLIEYALFEAEEMFQVPPIDSDREDGLKPEKITGNIHVQDVHFSYPTRPEVKVLDGINLEVCLLLSEEFF